MFSDLLLFIDRLKKRAPYILVTLDDENKRVSLSVTNMPLETAIVTLQTAMVGIQRRIVDDKTSRERFDAGSDEKCTCSICKSMERA